MLAILPIKSFSQAKQRLTPELDPGHRLALVQAMFSDVLLALRRSQQVQRVLVVSPNPVAQQIAAGHGAAVLAGGDSGHSAAALLGLRQAREWGEPGALLVPGDCPLLEPQELDALVSHPAAGPSVLIVPDRHGTGTNALLLRPPDSLEPAFGPGSCERHLAGAAAAGINSEIVELPSLAMDVDTPEDLATLELMLAERFGGAAHTRGMLRQIGRSRGS